MQEALLLPMLFCPVLPLVLDSIKLHFSFLFPNENLFSGEAGSETLGVIPYCRGYPQLEITKLHRVITWNWSIDA